MNTDRIPCDDEHVKLDIFERDPFMRDGRHFSLRAMRNTFKAKSLSYHNRLNRSSLLRSELYSPKIVSL